MWKNIVRGCVIVLLALVLLASLPAMAREYPDNVTLAASPVDNLPQPQFYSGSTRIITLQVQVQEDGSFLFPDGASVAMRNQYFLGWTTDPAGETAEYRAGDSGSVADAAEYYAVWLPVCEHTVVYVTDGVRTQETVRTGELPESVPDGRGSGRVLTAWKDESGALVQPAEQPVFSDVVYTAVYAPELTGEHVRYLNGYGDGTLRPDAGVTRAEAAMLLYNLLAEAPQESMRFSDVPADSWYAEPLGVLAAAGILNVSGDCVYPDQLVTRGEFVSMLARFFPLRTAQGQFSDVPPEHPAYVYVVSAAAYGWVTGYEDGSFRPDEPVTRAQAACFINGALGRSADRTAVDKIIFPVFSDVFSTHWAYYDLMEAAVVHTPAGSAGHEVWLDNEAEHLRYPTGPLLFGGELYYISEVTGRPVTDCKVGNLTFGPDGRYTSGNAELDTLVKQVLSQICTPEMDRAEMLRAAYLYTRDSFTYLRRNYYQIGDTGWETDEALTMLTTGRGNCYCYAATFCVLARQLGYDAAAISGVVGTTRSPHGWVEIEFGGITYIFDAELEMAYREKGKDYFDLYMMSYARIPWPYVK